MRRAEHKSRVRRSTVCWSGSLLAALAHGPCGPAFSGLCGVVCGKDLSDLGGKPGRVSAFVPVSLIELLIYAAILSALAGCFW